MALWYKITEVKADRHKVLVRFDAGEDDGIYVHGRLAEFEANTTMDNIAQSLGVWTEKACWEHASLPAKLQVLVGRKVDRQPSGWGVPWDVPTKDKA